jgi:hypothetical protein
MAINGPFSFLSTFSEFKVLNFLTTKNGDPPTFYPLLTLSKLRTFNSLVIGDGNPPLPPLLSQLL